MTSLCDVDITVFTSGKCSSKYALTVGQTTFSVGKCPASIRLSPPRIQKIVVAQIARHERIAALRNGLRDVFAARAAADGYAVHPPAAAAIAQAAAAE